ncbi:DUF1211 domain-containing protein [Spirosoma taeanense]|uniref:DUF1211 domain-containing protein n=2 Tax=Spirosoma taeanense TaxID=2735870 RepID=A0A6M5YFM3_9BACT|nr:DUF1211 domain-containing protein [Spirosoma taeanense]
MADFQENETVRMEAFSDGVFAIDITLLTFELKLPVFKEEHTSRSLFFAMLHQWPSYVAFLLSFATIFVIWVNHHRMYSVIRRSDARFMYYNGLLLLLTSLIPFTTNILARYIQTSATELATALSMLVFGATTGTFYLMWNYATQDYYLLKRPAADVRIHSVRNGLILSSSIYSVSALLAAVAPYVSLFIGLLMVVYLSRLKYHREKVV